jgi:hypothetical protein
MASDFSGGFAFAAKENTLDVLKRAARKQIEILRFFIN